ncbi:MAG: pilus assembly protein PilX [Pseudomonas sp.]|uniref:pilus assembly protein PilX n=1 Tax=Pseudomonas sp. TaxID=306 RepID=UPI003398BF26
MKAFNPNRQNGAVLLVALVMLLVLTLLAANSMRNVSLEFRITANRAQALQLSNSADAALREAEFRFYDPSFLRDKLEPSAANCATANVLKINGANKPCLLGIQEAKLLEFVLTPTVLEDSTKSTYLTSASTGGLIWMPYRGLDAAVPTSAEYPSTWNTYLITGGPDEANPANVEYSAAGEAKGTFTYLVNGQSSNNLGNRQALQSTISNIYVGLNN